MSLLLIAAFIGAAVGSFVNVWVLRTREGESIKGRSRCPGCGTTLQWFELIPLLSFLFLRGRCRSCRGAISLQYPVVEALTALLFVVVFLHEGGDAALGDGGAMLQIVLGWLVASISVALALYDMRALEVPSRWLWYFLVASALWGLARAEPLTFSGFWEVAQGVVISGFITGIPLAFLWLISRGGWLGEADVWVAIALGLVLGWEMGLSALLLAFWLGAGFVALWWALSCVVRAVPRGWLLGKIPPLRRRTPVPFLPFLLAALWITYAFSWSALLVYYRYGV
ncbi:prepilin peptidase [Candidatus Parcubacteria bacterium]|nr:MAG: prepilin peptidase [Candidatus Parcubacteria bacterium]